MYTQPTSTPATDEHRFVTEAVPGSGLAVYDRYDRCVVRWASTADEARDFAAACKLLVGLEDSEVANMSTEHLEAVCTVGALEKYVLARFLVGREDPEGGRAAEELCQQARSRLEEV